MSSEGEQSGGSWPIDLRNPVVACSGPRPDFILVECFKNACSGSLYDNGDEPEHLLNVAHIVSVQQFQHILTFYAVNGSIYRKKYLHEEDADVAYASFFTQERPIVHDQQDSARLDELVRTFREHWPTPRRLTKEERAASAAGGNVENT